MVERSYPGSESAEIREALAIAKRYADFISDDLPPEVRHPQPSQMGDALLVMVAEYTRLAQCSTVLTIANGGGAARTVSTVLSDAFCKSFP